MIKPEVAGLEAELVAAREELSARFVGLHEEEVRLRARERALKERAARLDESARSTMEGIERATAAQAEAHLISTRAIFDMEAAALKESGEVERRLLLERADRFRERAEEQALQVSGLSMRLQSALEENASLRAESKSKLEAARRLEAELAAARDSARHEATRATGMRREAEDLALRAESLEGALRAERARSKRLADGREELEAALDAREEALVRSEEHLHRRLLEVQKAWLSRLDDWKRREKEYRDGEAFARSGLEERARAADAELADIAALRRELISELTRRRAPESRGGH